MNDESVTSVETQYRCRTTQKWLNDGKVREKREIFRVYREDPERPAVVTRRERVVTFYTKLRGRLRLDNEIWFTTNDPAERERLRAEFRVFLTSEAPALRANPMCGASHIRTSKATPVTIVENATAGASRSVPEGSGRVMAPRERRTNAA